MSIKEGPNKKCLFQKESESSAQVVGLHRRLGTGWKSTSEEALVVLVLVPECFQVKLLSQAVQLDQSATQGKLLGVSIKAHLETT